MKLASKFIAALAVTASFSSFAVDTVDSQDLAKMVATITMADAVSLAGDGQTSNAAIYQTEGSAALISQTGINGASIIQVIEAATAAIVQAGDNNLAVIYQK